MQKMRHARHERDWFGLTNVRCHWFAVYGIGVFWEIDQWYSHGRDDYRWCLTFKISLLCLLVTGNLYLGPARPNTELTDGYRRTGPTNQPKSERR